jgi:hypothetical protein
MRIEHTMVLMHSYGFVDAELPPEGGKPQLADGVCHRTP